VRLVADTDGDLAGDDVERLGEVGVDVERRPGEAGRDDLLDEREAAVGVLAADADVDRGSEERVAGGRVERLDVCVGGEWLRSWAPSCATARARSIPGNEGLAGPQASVRLAHVLPRDQDYARVRRRIEAALGRPELSVDGVVRTFLEESADLLEISSACWHRTDPATGALVDGAAIGGAPGSLEESLVYEYRRPDINRFAELMDGRERVASIATSTGNQPGTSARFREMIEPTGTADELRVAFTDAYGVWMSLVVFTQRRMTETDLSFVSDVVPAATSAMRLVTAQSLDGTVPDALVDDGSAPSVLLLDAADRIVSADAVARKRLALLPGPGGDQAPGVMSFLAARARWDRDGGPATARMRTLDGRWFEIDVSVLDDAGTGNLAAVMQPAPSEVVLDTVLRAMGLSARQREVAALLAQGRPTKSIAAILGLSPWTVQDHVKAVHAKTGVARADLGALGAAWALAG